MEHVEHHEPHRGRFRQTAEQRCERWSEHLREIAHQRCRTEHTQPHDRKDGEVQRRHARAGKHGAGDVLLRLDRLADMARSSLKRWRRESDQVQAAHGTCELAERTFERKLQVKARCLLPVHVTSQ